MVVIPACDTRTVDRRQRDRDFLAGQKRVFGPRGQVALAQGHTARIQQPGNVLDVFVTNWDRMHAPAWAPVTIMACEWRYKG